MIKMINNTYRDLTFAFANEVALIAERMGLSAGEMIHAANVDYPRSNVARPGFVGGPCLEKDALILIDSLHQIDFRPRVIEEARRINQTLPDHVADRILAGIPRGRSGGGPALALVAGCALRRRRRPPKGGGKNRPVNRSRTLGRNHGATGAALAGPAGGKAGGRELEQPCNELHVARTPAYAAWGRFALHALTGYPSTFGYFY